MTLRNKFDHLENRMTNPDNPLLAGTHEHHLTVHIGGPNPHTDEWIVCVATGERLPVSDEWRKWVREYDTRTPDAEHEIRVTIGTPPDDGAPPTPNEVQ